MNLGTGHKVSTRVGWMWAEIVYIYYILLVIFAAFFLFFTVNIFVNRQTLDFVWWPNQLFQTKLAAHPNN